MRLVGGRAVGEEWPQIPRVERALATKTKTMPEHKMKVTEREKDWTLVMFGDQTRDQLTSVGKRTIMDPSPRVATWVRIRASHKKLASRIGK